MEHSPSNHDQAPKNEQQMWSESIEQMVAGLGFIESSRMKEIRAQMRSGILSPEASNLLRSEYFDLGQERADQDPTSDGRMAFNILLVNFYLPGSDDFFYALEDAIEQAFQEHRREIVEKLDGIMAQAQSGS